MSRRAITPAVGFVANQPLNVQCSFLGIDPSCQVTIRAFKLERSDGSRAGQGVKTGARGFGGQRPSNLSGRPGLQLLLIEVHLLLSFVLAESIA